MENIFLIYLNVLAHASKWANLVCNYMSPNCEAQQVVLDPIQWLKYFNKNCPGKREWRIVGA